MAPSVQVASRVITTTFAVVTPVAAQVAPAKPVVNVTVGAAAALNVVGKVTVTVLPAPAVIAPTLVKPTVQVAVAPETLLFAANEATVTFVLDDVITIAALGLATVVSTEVCTPNSVVAYERAPPLTTP